jgi:hypothetical protein
MGDVVVVAVAVLLVGCVTGDVVVVAVAVLPVG